MPASCVVFLSQTNPVDSWDGTGGRAGSLSCKQDLEVPNLHANKQPCLERWKMVNSVIYIVGSQEGLGGCSVCGCHRCACIPISGIPVLSSLEGNLKHSSKGLCTKGKLIAQFHRTLLNRQGLELRRVGPQQLIVVP